MFALSPEVRAENSRRLFPGSFFPLGDQYTISHKLDIGIVHRIYEGKKDSKPDVDGRLQCLLVRDNGLLSLKLICKYRLIKLCSSIKGCFIVQ